MAYTPNIARIEDDGTETSMALVERRELEKLRTLLAAREKECDELQAVIREICETAPIDAVWGLRNAPTWHRWRRAAGLERQQTECEKLVEKLMPTDRCQWTRWETVCGDEVNTWSTGCGKEFELNEGTPTANGMRFCYHCGKRIDQRPPEHDTANVPVSSGAASAPYAPAAGSEGRCPTCRQRNSRAVERTLDDGSVIVWYCNVQGCSNSADYPNAGTEARVPPSPPVTVGRPNGGGQ